LNQQRKTNLGEALEKDMKIEAMQFYPGRIRITRPLKDANSTQLQGQISSLTKKIQDFSLPKVG
jgi:hypothetical protein